MIVTNSASMCPKLFAVIFLINFGAADYWSDRSKIISKEVSESIGASIRLSEKEEKVNAILMKHKAMEFEVGMKHPGRFPPAMHFFLAKPLIEKSAVFRIIKMLPKGASLHSHHSALASTDYIYNLTFSPNLLGCVKNGSLYLNFPVLPPEVDCNWKLVSDLRLQNRNFDKFIKSQISMATDNPEKYPDTDSAWEKFTQALRTIKPMLKLKNILQNHFYQALQELLEDNVFYLEFRTGWKSGYDSQGNEVSHEDFMKTFIETVELFKRDHPGFYGAKAILGTSRAKSVESIANFTRVAEAAREKFPDFIAGFDLYGQEDKGKPLRAFTKELLEIEKKMKVFLHSGETNWNGVSTDLNLVDAVLMNTSRIGHGYAIVKHQEVMRLIKERNIAIEVCPISNQVLKLVSDLRNHPASILINQGFNVVICNDDPGVWGTKGLSYDWYMAFMGLASRQSDLRFLKQLAMNSILYSALDEQEKEDVMKKWEFKWEEFLNKVIFRKMLDNYVSAPKMEINALFPL